MKHILIILIIVLGTSTAVVSCKKSEEIVGKVKSKETHSATPEKGSLAKAMKKASMTMRRLSRAIEHNDWIEIDMQAHELKEGIGYNCVELYMKENPGISSEFIILGNKFYENINRLLLSSDERLKPVTDFQFSMIIKSCDDCHKIFYEKVGREMQFSDQIRIFLNSNKEINE